MNIMPKDKSKSYLNLIKLLVGVFAFGILAISSSSTVSATRYTKSTSVDLTINCDDSVNAVSNSWVSGCDKMNISNTTTFPEGNWVDYATSKLGWVLSSGDGSKTVYIKFKDKAANISSSPLQLEIFLDTQIPTSTITAPLASSPQTADFTVSVTDSDPSSSSGFSAGNCKYDISNTVGVSYTAIDRTCAAGNNTIPISLTASGSNSCHLGGSCTIKVYSKDNAGNDSNSTLASASRIFITSSAPEKPALNSASAGVNNATLSWNTPVNFNGSTITSYDVGVYTRTGTAPNLTYTLASSTHVNCSSSTPDPCTTPNTAVSTGINGLTNTPYYFKVTVNYGTSSTIDSDYSTFSVTPQLADSTAPTSSITSPDPVNPQGANFIVSITDADNTGGSGLATCYYSVIDNGTTRVNGQTRTCNQNITITVGPGNNCQTTGTSKCVVKAWATDIAGNGNINTGDTKNFTYATAPNPPTIGSAQPHDGYVVVFWGLPSDGGAAIDQYEVDTYNSSGTLLIDGQGYPFPVGTCTGGACSYTLVAGLTNGTQYQFKVRARNSVGWGSVSTDFSSLVKPLLTPPAPQFTTATVVSSTQINLVWSNDSTTATGALTYDLWRCPVANAADCTGWTQLFDHSTLLSKNDTGLSPNTDYTYRVYAINANAAYSGGTDISRKTSAGDTTAPSSGFKSPAAGSAQAVSFDVGVTDLDNPGGSGIDPSKCYYTIVNGSTTTVTQQTRTCSGSFTVTVGSGLNCTVYNTCHVTIWAQDLAGNGSSASGTTRDFLIATNPSAPTFIADTASNPNPSPGNTQATVSWNALSGTGTGGSPISSYTVGAYYDSNNSPAPDAQHQIVSTTTGTSTTVLRLTNGIKYKFKVWAYNGLPANYPGAQSSFSSAITPGTAPSKPIIGLASIDSADDGAALVSWNEPASDGFNAIKLYTVTSSPGGKTGELKCDSPCAGGTYSTKVAGLTYGTSYTFTVTATNVVGTSPASDPTPNSVIARPAHPTGYTASVGSATDATHYTVNLSWTAVSGASRYNIYSCKGGTLQQSCSINLPPSDGGIGSPSGGVDAPALSTTAIVECGTTFASGVTVIKSGVESGISNNGPVATPACPPSAPTGFSATGMSGITQINLSWTNAIGSGVDYYNIYRCLGSCTPTTSLFTQVQSSDYPTMTVGDNTVACNTTYTYGVIAHSNTNGDSAMTTASGTTSLCAPTNTSATAGTGGFSLTWSAPGGTVFATTPYIITYQPAGGTVTTLPAAGQQNITCCGDVEFVPMTPGIQYTFTVAAKKDGITGLAASTTAIITATAPDAPTISSATPAGDALVSVSWSTPASNGAAIDNYQINAYLNCNTGSTPVTTPSASSPGTISLTKGSSYCFKVLAHNSAGWGLPSAVSRTVIVGDFDTVDLLDWTTGVPYSSSGSGWGIKEYVDYKMQ